MGLGGRRGLGLELGLSDGPLYMIVQSGLRGGLCSRSDYRRIWRQKHGTWGEREEGGWLFDL